MARGVNKVIVIGNLGADPETRYMPDGTACATFSVAVSDKWTDRQTGEVKERTEWIRAEAWGKLAEICTEYLRKGSQVYIEGPLRTDKWDDNGVTKYMTKVRIDQMSMLGGKGGDEKRPAAQQQNKEPQQQPDFDDDIPF